MSRLNPEINQGPFTEQEDSKLARLTEQYGIGKYLNPKEYQVQNKCLIKFYFSLLV